LVLCTGAALRRPSVSLATRREEGCFSPAIGLGVRLSNRAKDESGILPRMW
jgi:hypothetical protein